MNTSKAKSLITGEKEPINEAPEGDPQAGGPGGPPPRRPGGPPMRPRPGGQGGPGMGRAEAPDEHGFTPRERQALKDLVIIDLLYALGNDPFYTEVANVALKGGPLSPAFVRHIMDEAYRYQDQMTPEVNAVMEKIAKMPTK